MLVQVQATAFKKSLIHFCFYESGGLHHDGYQ